MTTASANALNKIQTANDETRTRSAFHDLCTAMRSGQVALPWKTIHTSTHSILGRTASELHVDGNHPTIYMDIAIPTLMSRDWSGGIYVVARTYMFHKHATKPLSDWTTWACDTLGYHLFAVHSPLYWEIIADDKTETGLSDREIALLFQDMERRNTANDVHDASKRLVRRLKEPLHLYLESLREHHSTSRVISA